MLPQIVALCLLAAADPQILTVRRVYVDQFTGGAAAAQLRELIVASLQKTELIIVTENEQNADAVLRGAGDEEIFTELHSTDDNVTVRANFSRGRPSAASTKSTARDTDAGGLSLGERESSKIQERRRTAIATVRLVLKNGDVIWSTIQESGGAKFCGASADVAAKVSRQLGLDIERARKGTLTK